MRTNIFKNDSSYYIYFALLSLVTLFLLIRIKTSSKKNQQDSIALEVGKAFQFYNQSLPESLIETPLEQIFFSLYRELHATRLTQENLDNIRGKLIKELNQYHSSIVDEKLSCSAGSDRNKILNLELTKIFRQCKLTASFQNDSAKRLISPFLLAYMRAISKKIYQNGSTVSQLYYVGSFVDIIMPLLLLMCCPEKQATVFMVDINPELTQSLEKVKTDDAAIPGVSKQKLVDRFFHNFYIMSEFSKPGEKDHRIPAHIILSFFIKALEIFNFKINENQLIINFSGRIVTFNFIHGDATKLNVSLYTKEKPFIYLEKALPGLSAGDYFPRIFSEVKPEFLFISNRTTAGWDAKQASDLWKIPKKLSLADRQSFSKLMPFFNFVDNGVNQLTTPVNDPLASQIRKTILNMFSRGNREYSPVTEYHIPLLCQPRK